MYIIRARTYMYKYYDGFEVTFFNQIVIIFSLNKWEQLYIY